MSECGCIYMDVDSDAFECVSARKARKQHKCKECQRAIEPGDRYELRAHFDEGTVDTYKTCLLCAEIRDALFCSGWYYGNVWEQIEHSVFDYGALNSACLDKLKTVEAKQFLQARWWAWVERLAKERGAI